jgi:hypothetical protein
MPRAWTLIAGLSLAPERSIRRFVAALLGVMCALNVFDVAATLVLVGGGHATEGNPLMAGLLELGPLPFATIKIAVVTAGALVLFRYARHDLAQVGAILGCSAYGMLAIYHLGWMQILLV